jgi:hypothetical protein
MRALLLATMLVAAGWAGCLSDDGSSVPRLHVPDGTLATYEIAANGTTTTDTFVAAPTERPGVELWAHNATRAGFDSPLLSLDGELNPRGVAWDGLFAFPIEPGDEYTAQVGGVEADVETAATTYEVAGDEVDAVRATARADGETVAEVTVLVSPTLVAEAELDTPASGKQTWTLTDLGFQPGYDEPPRWDVGDWWRFDAQTRDADGQLESVDAKLVYNANDTAEQGTPQRVLNPTEVDDRPATFPFQTLRDRDLAPQSGYLTNLLSTFWQWPMGDSATWSGTSQLAPGDDYEAVVEVEEATVANRVTTVYNITATPLNEPGAGAFAAWSYVPAAGFVGHIWAKAPDADASRLDWTLTDWGEGYHGDMEVPQRQAVYGQSTTSGPIDRTEPVEVPAPVERVQIEGTFVRPEDARPELELELRDPDGDPAWTLNESALEEQRVVQLNDVIDAGAGNWTLETQVPEDVSYFLQLTAAWKETTTVDYR